MPTSQHSGHVLTPQLSGHVSTPQRSGHAAATGGPYIEAIQQCRVPQFWKKTPELWFLQVESIFQTHRMRSDDGKYHLVIGALDAESLLDVADILRSPPARDKYNYLKFHMMNRLAETTDRQLLRVLNELELGDKKPSQLLRSMRTLAGDKASEDVLRIKWLDLLPVSTQRLLKIFRATRLDELAVAADELMEVPTAPGPAVMATTTAVSRQDSASASDLSDIRRSLEELVSQNRELLTLTKGLQGKSPGGRSRSKSQGRGRSPSPAQGSMCRFHKKRCYAPCSFSTTAAAETTLPKN